MEGIAKLLEDIARNVKGVEYLGIVDHDGFIISSWGEIPMDEEYIGGITGAFVGIVKRAADEVGIGEREWIGIEGSNKKVFLWEIPENYILVAIAEKRTITGLLLTVAKSKLKALKEVLP